MAHPLPKWTREQIQQETLSEIEGLRKDFPDQAWVHELIPLLRELHALASQAQADQKLVVDLENRAASVLRKHKLKGLDPILWMIASLKDTK